MSLRRNNVLEIEGGEEYDAEEYTLRAERLKEIAIRSSGSCSGMLYFPHILGLY